MKLKKQFGGKISPAEREKYSKSPQWQKDKFLNQEETVMDITLRKVPKLIYKQIFETKGRMPVKPIPVEAFDLTTFLKDDGQVRFSWYGHSALLIRWNKKTILLDPMLGPDASPIAPFSTKRFSENTLALIDDFPPIDLLLMTHDHYDHLDLDSIERLKSKTSQWFVALGVARHLEAWGVPAEAIQEFDWWDRAEFAGIEFIFTPSRHFSGRGLSDRAQSLWGGWSMKTTDARIYWSGDGGYGKHFKEIGEKLGPFDLGFMECGQYNPNWHLIHMYPEEAVQASIDAKVHRAMPVHWAGFALAQHHWKDPIERFYTAAEAAGLVLKTPRIGEIFHPETETYRWWDQHE